MLRLTINRENSEVEFQDYLDYIPLTINVNNSPTSRTKEDSGNYTYTTRFGELSMHIAEDDLCVIPWEAGIYTIDCYSSRIFPERPAPYRLSYTDRYR